MKQRQTDHSPIVSKRIPRILWLFSVFLMLFGALLPAHAQAAEAVTVKRTLVEQTSTGLDPDDCMELYFFQSVVGESLGVQSFRAGDDFFTASASPAAKRLYQAAKEMLRKFDPEQVADKTGTLDCYVELTLTNEELRSYVPESRVGSKDGHEFCYFTASDLGLRSISYDSNGCEQAMDRFAEKYLGRFAGLRSEQLWMHDALENACPFDFYWCDIFIETIFTYSAGLNTFNGETVLEIGPIELGYYPAPMKAYLQNGQKSYRAYKAEGDIRDASELSRVGAFTVALNKLPNIQKAARNAAAIVQEAKGLTDAQKLRMYAERIAARVDYDEKSLQTNAQNNDFRQVIAVFDDDPATKAVCAGYTKAFQYLCNSTTFASGLVDCRSTTGNLIGGNVPLNADGSPNHVWNVVTMDDGRNYVIDMTSVDSDTGFNESFFLGYCTVQDKNGSFRLSGVSDNAYSYSSDARAIFTEKERTISTQPYAGPVGNPSTEGKPESGGASGTGSVPSGGGSTGAGASGGGCYVATAVYGSYDCPEVWTLRRFRDEALAQTAAGRAFIYTYYAVSPTIVQYYGAEPWFQEMWRGTLDRMVERLQEKGYEDTPYADKDWQSQPLRRAAAK